MSQGSITSALIYTRVSSDEQEREGLSLPTQIADCRRYAAERAWSITREYQDVLKGTRDDRPQYQAMLADVRRLRADGATVVVVVKWLHRLGRRVLESVRAREELKGLGVAVHSTMEGGPVSDFLANIMSSTAQYEVEQLGERVREVNHHIIEKGWRPVGRCPWGYRWRDATDAERASGAPKKVLETDKAAAPFVTDCFSRVAGGETVRSVARWAAALPNEVRGGRSLSFDIVRRMLSAPVYAGQSETDERGRSHQGHWPALVDQQTWDRAQVQIQSHARVPHQATGRHLLTGLIRCPSCGSRMGGATRRTKRAAVCVYLFNAWRQRARSAVHGHSHGS